MELNVKFDLPFSWCTMCGAFYPTFGEPFMANGEVYEKTLPRCMNDDTCKAMAAAHDKFLDIMREEQKNGND